MVAAHPEQQPVWTREYDPADNVAGATVLARLHDDVSAVRVEVADDVDRPAHGLLVSVWRDYGAGEVLSMGTSLPTGR